MQLRGTDENSWQGIRAVNPEINHAPSFTRGLRRI